MLSPLDPRIKNNLPKIKEVIMKDNVILYFIPSPHLKELISRGQHALIQGIANNRKIELLSGLPQKIQKRMVWKWLNNTLDEKNSFILTNGEIRVVDNKLTSHNNLIGNQGG